MGPAQRLDPRRILVVDDGVSVDLDEQDSGNTAAKLCIRRCLASGCPDP